MIARWIWIAVLVVILDQVTKLLAVEHLAGSPIAVIPMFNLALAFNFGAAFSFLATAGGWQHYFFVAIAMIVSVVILVMAYRLPRREGQVAVALMLVLGGAIGNVIDRIRLGYVVDFLDFYFKHWHFPTFNIADSAISIGAVLLILDSFGLRWTGQRKQSP